MKKFLSLVTASLAAAFLLTAAIPARADVKVGTVDMNKVFQSYYKTKDAENRINDQKKAAQDEFNSRMDAYRKGLEELQTITKQLEDHAVSQAKKDEMSKKRDAMIAENQNQQKELESFQKTRERQIQEQILRERNRIVEEIMKLIQDKVKAESFDLVFDKSGNSFSNVPLVLYSRDNMDFSEEIIKLLNKNRPADAPAPSAGGPAATPAPPAPAPSRR